MINTFEMLKIDTSANIYPQRRLCCDCACEYRSIGGGGGGSFTAV